MPAVGVALVGLAASAAATSALTGAVIAGITISATAASFIGGVVGLVVSTGLSMLLNRAPSISRADAQAADRKQAVRSGIAPRNIVYGRSLVAGPIIYMGSEGQYKEWMHVVMPLAGHPVHAFDSVRFNGFTIPVTSRTAGGDGTAGAGVDGAVGFAARVFVRIRAGQEQGIIPAGDISTVDYPDYDQKRDALMRITLYDGTQTAAPFRIVAELPEEWDSAMTLSGLPFIHMRVRYSNDVMPGGFQALAVELRGKRLWDPRSDTTAYSDNAALAALDYLTSPEGLGVPSSEIDVDATSAAINICDEDVDLDLAGTQTQPRFTTNGSFRLDQSPIDIMEALLNGWGTLVYVQGLYRIHAAAHVAATQSLAAGDFAGPVELVRNHARRDAFNAVTGTYVEPGQGWEAVAFPKVVSAAYLAQDGEEVAVSLDLPFVLDARRAQRLARLRVLTHRASGFQVRGTLKYSALRMTVWDTVDLTLPEFGLEADTFRVTALRFEPVSGLVSVTLQSDVPEAYAWTAADAVEPILSEVTSLVSPLAIPAGETPVLTEGFRTQNDGTIVPRLLVTWSADLPTPYLTGVEIQWRNTTRGDGWSSRLVPNTESQTSIEPVQPGDDHDVRLRYTTLLTRGPWSAIADTVGEGSETATPAGPSGAAVAAILGGYRVTFTPAPAADLAATEIGEDVTPFEGTIVYVAETTGAAHVRMTASGDYAERRVYLRSRNTAGQRSAWGLAGTVTPQASGTVDIAPEAVLALATDASIVTFVPAGTAWEDTSVDITVTVAAGEKVVLWMTARLEEYIDGSPTGGGGEGGQESGG
jgi:hypothetical protein